MTKETLPAKPIEGALSTLDETLVQTALKDSKKMKALLVVIDEEIEKFPEPDTSTGKGRDAIKANAFMVTRSKTAIDGIGKDLTESARAMIASINGQKKIAVEHLADKAKEIRKPLTDWEEAEGKRKDALTAGLTALVVTLEMGATAKQVAEERTRITSLHETTDWQEVSDEANTRHERASQRLDELQAFFDEQERQRKEAEEARQAAAKAEEERLAAEQRAQEAEAAAEALRAKEREAEAGRLVEETQRREAAEAELAELRAAQQAIIDEAEAEATAANVEAEQPEVLSDADLAEKEAAPAEADPEAEATPASRETFTPAQVIQSLEHVHDSGGLSNTHRIILMDAVALIRRLANV